MNIPYMQIFFTLISEEFLLFKNKFWNKLINAQIWTSSMLLVSAYILPSFGISSFYGSLVAVGLITSCGLFEIDSQMVRLVSDFEGEQQITYYLTLPLPTWLVFVKIICIAGFHSLMMGIVAFFNAKILLMSGFDLTNMSILKTMIALLLVNSFFGSFALLCASLAKSLVTTQNVSMRLRYPLWMFGGFQFTWHILHNLNPWAAYLALVNPFMLCTEGMRTAILGQSGYLPFFCCMGGLLIMTLLCTMVAIQRLKKRLDFV